VADLPSGTVTFLFTDLEGSSRLWEEHPDAMQDALACHDEILRESVESRAGFVVKTMGDGFHAAFATAGDALSAAIDAQRALAAEGWDATGPLLVRMGLLTGEAQQRDGDFFGSAVNRAARVMAVAHGGQILCSRVTVDVAGGVFPVRSLGEHRLRDLGAPEELFQVGGGVFPPLQSVDVVPTNLPVVRTELIGRSDDVATLSELVRREQLVTLTGVGGVGKTRLALGVAASVAVEFADGCWLVELPPVTGGDEVVNAVAASVRSPTTGLDGLAAYLADRRVLVVLDNCEHVLDAAAQLVDVVLASAPDVHVVVTSREPLGLDGEQVRRVRSLDLPDAGGLLEEVRAAAAVRLFAERAMAAAGSFVVDAGNAAPVVEICRHLDGIPLAIELAAARVRSMPPVEIARRLDERFRLLGGGSRRAQERHRTLFAAVSWSYEMLTEDEGVTFRRLAVFPASFDLAAAEAVAGADNSAVVDRVSRLVDRSLVDYEPGTGRYRLLETLRQFGADRLAEAGETEATRARHAGYFLALTQRYGPLLDGAAYDDAAPAVGLELDNLRATADWCVEAGRWEALAAMCRSLWYFITQSAPVDGVAWYHQFLGHADALDDQLVADALGELAFLEVYNFADYDAADALSRWSRELADAKTLHEPAAAWVATGLIAALRGDLGGAVSTVERGLVSAEARGDEKMALTALMMQPFQLAQLGDYDRASDVANEVLRRAKRYGHPTMISAAVNVTAGLYAWLPGEPDFVTCLEILERERVGHSGGEVGAMWLDLTRAHARLGLKQPGAVEDFAAVARAADRLNAPHVLDQALRALAVVAAEAGLETSAHALVAYAETNLLPYRTGEDVPYSNQARLDRALAAPPELPTPPGAHRSEIMALVNELESMLTRDGPGAPSWPTNQTG
jgi:predicted ATPase/class 3 adenylate cyclase